MHQSDWLDGSWIFKSLHFTDSPVNIMLKAVQFKFYCKALWCLLIWNFLLSCDVTMHRRWSLQNAQTFSRESSLSIYNDYNEPNYPRSWRNSCERNCPSRYKNRKYFYYLLSSKLKWRNKGENWRSWILYHLIKNTRTKVGRKNNWERWITHLYESLSL